MHLCEAGFERQVLQLDSREVLQQTFKVLQWNILGDGLAQTGDFVKVLSKGEEHANHVLSWEYRITHIVRELLASNADILCLQEVTHFDQLKQQLQPHGYTGHWHPKNHPKHPPDAPPCVDGSAVFFRTSRFRALRDPTGEVYQQGGCLLTQGCLLLPLLDVETGRQLLMATTHLKAKEGAANEDMRLCQVEQLQGFIQQGLQAAAGSSSAPAGNGNGNGTKQAPTENTSSSGGHSVLVCGDFNATPQAPCIQNMGRGPLPLRSIWEVPVAGGPPPQEFTTWKFRSGGESRRTIDYIWYTPGGCLVPKSRWQMPGREEIGPDALPNEAYPSDHLAVCCEFGWAAE